jgi:hypothetical protein
MSVATWYDGLCECLGDAAAHDLLEWVDFHRLPVSAYADKLSKPQIICLHAYTMSRKRDGLTVHHRLNDQLRFPGKTIEVSHALDEFRFMLISAIENLIPWSGLAYRRTDLPASTLEEVRTGWFADAGFLSCTTRSDLNLFGGRDWLTLRSKTGRRIADFSANPEEDEVVFLPNTRFDVSRLEETPDGAIVILNEV